MPPIRARSPLRSLVVAVGAALAATGCDDGERAGAPQSSARETPRLVFNRSIGDVRLNMARSDVERRYGAPTRQKVLRQYFPVGTRYEGKEFVRVVYRRPAGVLKLGYVDDKVKTIETTSAHYRTARGIGVGTRLPRNRCMRLNEIGNIGPRGCNDRWRGFIFEGECGDAWLTRTGKTMTALYMMRSRTIRTVQIGDSDVILYCF